MPNQRLVLVIPSSVIRICFEFRASIFGFRNFPLSASVVTAIWRYTRTMAANLLSVPPRRDPTVSSPTNHPRKHEPLPRIRTSPQAKPRARPDFALGGTHRRHLRHHRIAPDHRRDSDPIALSNADMSWSDYALHRSGDLSRHLHLMQRRPRWRLFALRQQLLARIQHGDLHRFAAVQCDLGFVRNSIRSGRSRLHDSARDRPIASTNVRNVPEWESSSDSHYDSKRA
jgi:hypothetical protein